MSTLRNHHLAAMRNIKHIRPRRMWDYINFQTELTAEEHLHLATCDACLVVFKQCALIGDRNAVKDQDDGDAPKQASS